MSRLRESRFRGSVLPKIQHASWAPEKTFKVLLDAPKMAPSVLVDTVNEIKRTVTNPSLSVLTALAKRSDAASTQFFPPQIVDTLCGFGFIGFHHEGIESCFLAREKDVLFEASPRRVVLLLEAIANLHMVKLYQSIRPELIRVLPQIRRGIPSVLDSLSRLGIEDPELVEALLTHAKCLWRGGEIDGSVYYKSLEAASRMEPEFVKDALSGLTVKNVDACVASFRCGLLAKGQLGEGDLYAKARRLAGYARHGVPVINVPELLEEGIGNADFAHKFLPYSVWHSVVSYSASDDLVNHVLNRISESPHAGRLAADKILCLLRAASATRANETVKSRLIQLISPVARQLSLREGRFLWDVVPGLIPTCALPPLRQQGESVVVGPVTLSKNEEKLSLFMPKYQVITGSHVRRDTELRRSAIERIVGRSVEVTSE